MSDQADPLAHLAEVRVRCWRRLVDAVIYYQLGNTDMVVQLLKQAEAEHGRPAALLMREEVRAVAYTEAFEDAKLWPANNYVPTKRAKDNAHKR